MRWRSSIADDPRARFTVRRGRRRCAAVFIDRRRSHGALHCTPGAQAFCTGARKYWPFGGDPMPTAFTIWGTHYGLGPATHEPPSHLLGVKDQAFPSRAKLLGCWAFGGDPMPTAFAMWGARYGLGLATHEPLRAPSHLLGVKDQTFPSGAKTLGMLAFWRGSLQSGGSLPRPGHEPGLRPGTPGRAQPQASKSGQSNRNRNLS